MNLRQAVLGSRWRELRESIDRLETDLMHSRSPLPTDRMVRYLIVAEDRRFGQHFGFDPVALLRAIWKTWWYDTPQGGSTVAMQLVRTLTKHSEPTLRRKLLEIYLAVLTSKYIAQRRLPLLYLWCAYYGWKMNSFTDACRRLGVEPSTASEVEEAELVARLKYPEPKQMTSLRQQQIYRRGLHILNLSARSDWTKWSDKT